MNAIIALNPQQMAEAQSTTLSWIEKKLAAAEQETDEADKLHESLVARGMRPDVAKSMMNKAARRVRFYEKCKAALAAGFYIIPPFDIQLFAIRTNRVTAKSDKDHHPWSADQKPQSLAHGEGRYVNPSAPRFKSEVIKEPHHNDPTKTRDVQLYENGNWHDELDLPVRAMKPVLIEAAGRALELKIFDALGIAPAYKSADPIIAGQILRPDGKGALTFFVAWWLDESDL